jgi:protoheme IX farnesyltransferase
MNQPFEFKNYLEMIKPRIAVLVLVTTFSGMWLGNKGMPDLALTLFTLLGVGLAAGSSSIFNNIIDRNADQMMTRTKDRSLATGRVSPGVALKLGLFMGATSFSLLSYTVNLMTAFMALFSILFYVFIYTLWLKRSTSLCTLIGGVAGALPPVMGFAAVDQLGVPALVLFLILFIWQPPHFWALAIVKKEEYRAAGFPMLPVVKGDRATQWQMLIYTIILVPVTLIPYYIDIAGLVYLSVASVFGFIYLAWTIVFMKRPYSEKETYRLFYFSIFYLAVIYITLFANHV